MKKGDDAPNMSETQLYAPVAHMFAEKGFLVRAEVHSCDLVAVLDNQLIIVELKTSFNLKLILQATQRQKTGAKVYVAIPRPKGGLRGKAWKQRCHLLKALELGLILVSWSAGQVKAEVIFEPSPFRKENVHARNKSKQKHMMNEAVARTGDYNCGGSVKVQLNTSYREQAIYIACCLASNGPMSTRDLRKVGTGDMTTTILYQNHYGWFAPVARGVYALTEKGATELATQPADLVQYYKAKVCHTNEKIEGQ